MSAVPMALVFRPLSPGLAYSGFSEQCGQGEQETVGTVGRINDPGTNSTVQLMFHSFLRDRVEKETAIHSGILA